MTIAAGFNFDDGIILCADKKHAAQMKLSASKIFTKTYADGSKSVIAIAGNVMYARMGMQAIEAGISDIPDAERSSQRMASVVTHHVRVLHHAHLFKHPQTPEVSYLVGLWSPIDCLKLLTTSDTAVNELRGYDCVGTGSYLAHYLIRAAYQDCEKNYYNILAIAINALARIKSYDDACGGASEFVALRNTGELSPVETFDIFRGEKYAEQFDESSAQLFIALSRPNITVEAAQSALKGFNESIEKVINEIRASEAVSEIVKKLKLEAAPKETKEEFKKIMSKLKKRDERRKL